MNIAKWQSARSRGAAARVHVRWGDDATEHEMVTGSRNILLCVYVCVSVHMCAFVRASLACVNVNI